MASAQDGLKNALDNIRFYDPIIPVIGNVTAKPLKTTNQIKKELEMQLTSCVQWNNSINMMLDSGVNQFYEIGHGKILSGILKRIDRSTTITSISNYDDVDNYAN
jgi:[acyl-carrier-protein] S-malonyltransferase